MKKKLNINPVLTGKNIALFVGFLIVLNILQPSTFTSNSILMVGDIAPRDIIAPHTFYIAKNKRKLREEREKAREAVPLVLSRTNEIAQSIELNVKNFFTQLDSIRGEKKSISKKRADLISMIPSLTREEVDFLLLWDYKTMEGHLFEILQSALLRGVVNDKSALSEVVVLDEKGIISKADLLDLYELPMFFKEEMLQGSRREMNTFLALATFFIRPNLTINLSETLRRKEQAAARVETTKGVALKGEMIIRAHDIVTQEVVDKLSSLSQDTPIPKYRMVIGRNILYLITILIFFLCIYSLSPLLFTEFRKLFLLVSLICLTMGISHLIISKGLSDFLIPVAAFGILVSLLLGVKMGLAGIITLTVLIATYSSGGLDLVSLFLFSGTISVFASIGVKRMSDFYKPTLCLLGAYICTALGVELMKLSPLLPLLKSVGYATIGGVGSAFIAFGLFPLLERSFKITTQISLLEYADLDNHLLRELSTYAPGTYHHSITVAGLTEAAARTVDANPLLARVGAYYHDIGKLKKPSYFIENQTSEISPHAKLNPELNALVIISHVREGVELAKKEKLPIEIVDIIREHQGTTLIEPFYAKAIERGKDTNELDFRYQGPLPRTKESAIVMLADAIEATARSLPEPTPSKLKGVIEEIIKKRVDDGQLSKVNLSLQELQKIGDSFLPILRGVFHPRVKYAKNLHKEPKKEPKNKGKRT